MTAPAFKSGKIVTGTTSGLGITTPESGDVIADKRPKVADGAIRYKARYAPLNLATPKGEPIQFTKGYFMTARKDIQEYLKANHVGKTCDIC